MGKNERRYIVESTEPWVSMILSLPLESTKLSGNHRSDMVDKPHPW
jgi:hypothetical protein